MTVLTDTQIVNASGGLVELAYGEVTSQVTITSTSAASPTVLVPSITAVCDGSPVLVEFFTPYLNTQSGSNTRIALAVDGAYRTLGISSPNAFVPSSYKYRFTPSAGSHTFAVGGYADLSGNYAGGGTGGTGAYTPMFLRVSKVVQANQWPAVTTGTIICTSSTRPSSPFQGQWIYETDTSRNYQWTGTAWSMQTKVAVALASAAAQTSMATGATLTGMTTTQTFNGLPVFVNCQAMFDGPAVGNWIAIGVYLDGTLQQYTRAAYLRTSEANFHLPISAMFTPTAGSHTVDVRVQSQSVTTWNSYNRVLNLYEVG